jgi:glycosyltransferase involved in cell wall biosynthesis
MNDDDSKIAIGMPVYNGAEYVEGAVRSLLAQTEKDFVLLISDDCSTDETAEICRRLSVEDARVSFVRHEASLGMTANFLYVLRNTRSTYFMWAAQDDWWDPEFLREGVRQLRAHGNAIGFMPAVKFIDADSRILHIVQPPRGLRASNAFVRARAVKNEGFHAIYALFHRCALVADVHLEDVASPDVALVFGLALRGPFALSDRVLSVRRDIGYRSVPDSERRRLVFEKALGKSGHLYSRSPNGMCWWMVRYTCRAQLRAHRKALLIGHILRAWWWWRWRDLLLSDSSWRVRRAAQERNYLLAAALLIRHTLLSPASVVSACLRRLPGSRGA